MVDERRAPETRGERKERTRRAILDAALSLCEDSSLVALSLRQVAKEVGIVPTAFYRHFDSIEALGLALVDESFVSLRAMLRDVRRGDPALADIVDSSVDDPGRARPPAARALPLHRPRARRRAARRCARRSGTRSSCSSASSPPTSPGCPAPTLWSAEDLRVALQPDRDGDGRHRRGDPGGTAAPDAEKEIVERPAPSCGWCWSAPSTGAPTP